MESTTWAAPAATDSNPPSEDLPDRPAWASSTQPPAGKPHRSAGPWWVHGNPQAVAEAARTGSAQAYVRRAGVPLPSAARAGKRGAFVFLHRGTPFAVFMQRGAQRSRNAHRRKRHVLLRHLPLSWRPLCPPCPPPPTPHPQEMTVRTLHARQREKKTPVPLWTALTCNPEKRPVPPIGLEAARRRRPRPRAQRRPWRQATRPRRAPPVPEKISAGLAVAPASLAARGPAPSAAAQAESPWESAAPEPCPAPPFASRKAMPVCPARKPGRRPAPCPLSTTSTVFLPARSAGA